MVRTGRGPSTASPFLPFTKGQELKIETLYGLIAWAYDPFRLNVLTIPFNLPLQIRGLRREVYRAFPGQVLSRSFCAGMMTVILLQAGTETYLL